MRYIFMMLIAFSQTAVAESHDVTATGDTITTKHRYTMGDNDSKSDATTICFLEAKRKAIEYAGIYVESTFQISQTDKSRIAKGDMKTIAAALVSAEMVSSVAGFDNGKMFVDCTVKAKVDRSKLKQEIERINADPEAKRQVEEQQVRLKNLETEVLRLQSQLQSSPRQESVTLRQERTAVFSEIDSLQRRKQDIVSVIEGKGRDAQQLITRGMTKSEVISLVGKPRSTIHYMGEGPRWNYGTTWVLFDQSEIVQCTRQGEITYPHCP